MTYSFGLPASANQAPNPSAPAPSGTSASRRDNEVDALPNTLALGSPHLNAQFRSTDAFATHVMAIGLGAPFQWDDYLETGSDIYTAMQRSLPGIVDPGTADAVEHTLFSAIENSATFRCIVSYGRQINQPALADILFDTRYSLNPASGLTNIRDVNPAFIRDLDLESPPYPQPALTVNTGVVQASAANEHRVTIGAAPNSDSNYLDSWRISLMRSVVFILTGAEIPHHAPESNGGPAETLVRMIAAEMRWKVPSNDTPDWLSAEHHAQIRNAIGLQHAIGRHPEQERNLIERLDAIWHGGASANFFELGPQRNHLSDQYAPLSGQTPSLAADPPGGATAFSASPSEGAASLVDGLFEPEPGRREAQDDYAGAVLTIGAEHPLSETQVGNLRRGIREAISDSIARLADTHTAHAILWTLDLALLRSPSFRHAVSYGITTGRDHLNDIRYWNRYELNADLPDVPSFSALTHASVNVDHSSDSPIVIICAAETGEFASGTHSVVNVGAAPNWGSAYMPSWMESVIHELIHHLTGGDDPETGTDGENRLGPVEIIARRVAGEIGLELPQYTGYDDPARNADTDRRNMHSLRETLDRHRLFHSQLFNRLETLSHGREAETGLADIGEKRSDTVRFIRTLNFGDDAYLSSDSDAAAPGDVQPATSEKIAEFILAKPKLVMQSVEMHRIKPVRFKSGQTDSRHTPENPTTSAPSTPPSTATHTARKRPADNPAESERTAKIQRPIEYERESGIPATVANTSTKHHS